MSQEVICDESFAVFSGRPRGDEVGGVAPRATAKHSHVI
jgi:hypothetical protein